MARVQVQWESTLEYDDEVEIPDSVDLTDHEAVSKAVYAALEAQGSGHKNILGERIDESSVNPYGLPKPRKAKQ